MTTAVFRFAPSPNGELHLGHAYSALLNDEMARSRGGRLPAAHRGHRHRPAASPASRPGSSEDLAWLGLAWEEPVRIQSEHFGDYDANLLKLWDADAIYPCFCSRRQAAAEALPQRDPDGQAHYGRRCRALTRHEAASRMAAGAQFGWRLDMVRAGDAAAAAWGDVVIAKKNVGSSYHIAVVTDDALQGVTHVVRGLDMEPATPIHMLLQRLLGLPAPAYHHHRLILDADGRKLSKVKQQHGAGVSAGARRYGGADPQPAWLRPGKLEVAGDALRLPVAIARGLGAGAAVHFLRQGLVRTGLAAGFRFRQGASGFGGQSGLVLGHRCHHMMAENPFHQGVSLTMNTLRTGLLLAALTGLFLAVGYLIGREQGMLIAFLVAAAMNFFAYWNSDKMVLRMHGARQVDRNTAPEFYDMIEELAQRAELPMPKVYHHGQSAAQRLRDRAQSRRTPRSPPPPACCKLLTPRRDRRRHGA